MGNTSTPDFLDKEAVDYEALDGAPDLFSLQLDLLRDIRRGIHRISPGAICTLVLEFTGVNPGYITGSTDRVRVRFKNNGRLVKATNIMIGNNSTQPIGFTVEQPIVQLAAGVTSGFELAIAAVQPMFIVGEIDFLEIAVAAAGPVTVSVNNSAALTATGVVNITAWTIPEDGK